MSNSTNVKGFLPRNFNRKYRIKELIYQYPPKQRAKKLEELAVLMDLDASSVRRIWGYRPEDTSEAKPSQLLAAAQYFNVPLEEIFSNHKEVVFPMSS